MRTKRTPLQKLAKLGKFNEINTILNENSLELEGWIHEWRCVLPTKRYDGNEDGIGTGRAKILSDGSSLHLIMVHRPPESTVRLLIQRLNQFEPDKVHEEVMDSFGRTPLHLACFHHVDVAVVRLLLNGRTLLMPALSRDQNGCLPLHLAINHCNRQHRHQRLLLRTWSKVNNDNYLSNISGIVSTLLEKYPEAVLIPNLNGLSPLAIARRQKFDARITNLLEDCASEQLWSTYEFSGSVDLSVPRNVMQVDDDGDVSTIHTAQDDLDHEDCFDEDYFDFITNSPPRQQSNYPSGKFFQRKSVHVNDKICRERCLHDSGLFTNVTAHI